MKINNPVWFALYIFIICFWLYDIGANGFNGDKAMVLSLAGCLTINELEYNNNK